jgi:hypothetical protein
MAGIPNNGSGRQPPQSGSGTGFLQNFPQLRGDQGERDPLSRTDDGALTPPVTRPNAGAGSVGSSYRPFKFG